MYPTIDEINEVLASLDIPLLTSENLILSVINEFELRTGWSPFIAEEVASVRFFDPPTMDYTNELTCNNGMNGTTEIYINVSLDNPSGDLLVENKDYFFREEPHKVVLMQRSCGLNSVKISSQWGYSTTLPLAVYSAIFDMVVASRATQATKGSISKLKEQQVEIEYAISGGRDSISRANEQFESVINAYMRMP